MHTPTAFIQILLQGAAATLLATLLPAAEPPSPLSPVQNEVLSIAKAHAAARADDDTDTDTRLSQAAVGDFAERPDSVLLARRAAAVCGWLQNENEHGRAMKLARRVIARLGQMKETSDADRAERLYWEAWLKGQVLDDKPGAIALLRTAETLAPEDERITSLELGFVQAVNSFGR